VRVSASFVRISTKQHVLVMEDWNFHFIYNEVSYYFTAGKGDLRHSKSVDYEARSSVEH